VFHLVAWYEIENKALAFTPVAAVREEMLSTNGDDIRVHPKMPFLIGAGALIADATGLRAQIQSPSLRTLANLDIEPIVQAAVFGSPPEELLFPDTPVPLTADEALNFFCVNNVAACVNYGLAWLSDGPLQPVKGRMFSVAAASAIAQAAGVWTNGNLVLGQVLPAGRYQVVGFRARSANAVAARLVFPEQIARPGVPVVNAIGDLDPWWSRYGYPGVLGEFDANVPPTVDVLGGVAAVQDYVLDLIKVK
jgi:hypothetical protein